MCESLPAHWQFYAARSTQTHNGRVDDFGYGREELLSETLKEIEVGRPWTESCRQRLDRIPRNRSKKFRRLRAHLVKSSAASHRREACYLELADLVDQVRGMMSTDEWEIEKRLAAGETFSEIATTRGLSLQALKVRAGRWRARIRLALAP